MPLKKLISFQPFDPKDALQNDLARKSEPVTPLNSIETVIKEPNISTDIEGTDKLSVTMLTQDFTGLENAQIDVSITYASNTKTHTIKLGHFTEIGPYSILFTTLPGTGELTATLYVPADTDK